MWRWCLILLLAFSVAAGAQSSSPATPRPAKSQSSESSSADSSSPAQAQNPNLAPPRSDTVNANALEPGQSSSKETQVDLTPPEDDAKSHPQSSEMLRNEVGAAAGADVNEFQPWDPHRAAKDIEVGDFYFKRKNYAAAESRYREALYYKNNDAIATFRLAECLEKMDQREEARQQFENYLKILPGGPHAEDARKAMERLKRAAANAKPPHK